MSEQDVKTMTEEQMRGAKVPWFKTAAELQAYITALAERNHDYGTCVYAMSMAAEAAFNFVAGKLGVTGFQASCADMDLIRRTRSIEGGFRLTVYNKLLYPQYCDAEHFPGYRELMIDQAEWLAKEAAKLIAAREEQVHPDVLAHWKMLAAAHPAGSATPS